MSKSVIEISILSLRLIMETILLSVQEKIVKLPSNFFEHIVSI